MSAALSIPLPADPATSELAEAACVAVRDKRRTLLTRKGTPVAALVPIEDLQAPEAAARILEGVALNLHRTREALLAMAAKEGPTPPLTDALAELDRVLESLQDDGDSLAVQAARVRWAVSGREPGTSLEEFAARRGIVLPAPE